jgi:hypothetical protein
MPLASGIRSNSVQRFCQPRRRIRSDPNLLYPFSRLITIGYDVGKLTVQRRLAGDIHDLVTTVFHGNASWDYEDRIDLTGSVNLVKAFNKPSPLTLGLLS